MYHVLRITLPVMKLFTVEQMVAAEKAADAQGITYDRMMETAGRRLAEAMLDRYKVAGRHVLILVGPGNNGGDGLVAGRYLAQAGAQVAFYLYKARDPAQDNNLAQVVDKPLQVMAEDGDFDWLRAQLATVDFLIDGLLGTGVSRPITGKMATLLQKVAAILQERTERQIPAPPLTNPAQPNPIPTRLPVVVAVDCPSGLNCDSGTLDPLALPADLTVTFAGPKWGHYLFPGAGACGQLVVADIGIPATLPAIAKVKTEVATADLARRLLPLRPLDGHKGTFGKVLIVAGSHRYWGAPLLGALGALRAGSGLVALCVPQSIRATIAGQLPEATFVPVADEEILGGETAVSLHQSTADFDAILIGPGLADAADFMQTFFGPNRPDPLPPLVIDADGLNQLATLDDWPAHLPPSSILTPHPGEMARLVGLPLAQLKQQNRLELAQTQAIHWQQIVVLKGAYTVVAAPNSRCTVIPFANPGLGTAGSGDVLAGVLVSLLGQGVDRYEAAVLGCYLHALAGALTDTDSGLLAHEIADKLPSARQNLLET
jgi:ADP-dependent NAD(P)H-hydrate dehydratase / NAD(P)H-hydrate epimerase